MEDRFTMLARVLPGWFDGCHRDLPWRRDREPYHVWLSEVMLQQNRVEAVRGYFIRFLEALPPIAALAAAEPDALHKLWEGLGYYSRVRNLQKAAQIIMAEHGGVFPREYEAIRALPGIGDYTAGAVASICFELPRRRSMAMSYAWSAGWRPASSPSPIPGSKRRWRGGWRRSIPQAAAARSPRA